MIVVSSALVWVEGEAKKDQTGLGLRLGLGLELGLGRWCVHVTQRTKGLRGDPGASGRPEISPVEMLQRPGSLATSSYLSDLELTGYY